jgi:hypothetical protein
LAACSWGMSWKTSVYISRLPNFNGISMNILGYKPFHNSSTSSEGSRAYADTSGSPSTPVVKIFVSYCTRSCRGPEIFRNLRVGYLENLTVCQIWSNIVSCLVLVQGVP